MIRKTIYIFVFLFALASIARAESFVVSRGETNALAMVAQFIMTDIYARLGHQVTSKHRPLKRSLVETNAGLFDAEVGRVKGMEEQFPNLVRVPVSIYKLEGVVFTKHDFFQIGGWESLRPYKIGVLRGAQFAEKGTEYLNREFACTLKSLFRMLDTGRFDIVVESRLNDIIAIEQLGLKDFIQILEPPLVTFDLYHYVHNKNAYIVPKMTELLSRMKRDGSLDKLIRQSEERVVTFMTRKNDINENMPIDRQKMAGAGILSNKYAN